LKQFAGRKATDRRLGVLAQDRELDASRARAGGCAAGSWLRYQAWVPPQWGQSTEVDTSASNTKPQWHA
jgi:hypothetical protein